MERAVNGSRGRNLLGSGHLDDMFPFYEPGLKFSIRVGRALEGMSTEAYDHDRSIVAIGSE